MVKTAERQLGCRKIVASFRGASAASLLGGTTGGNFTQANNTKLTSRRIRWIVANCCDSRYLHFNLQRIGYSVSESIIGASLERRWSAVLRDPAAPMFRIIFCLLCWLYLHPAVFTKTMNSSVQRFMPGCGKNASTKHVDSCEECQYCVHPNEN